MHCEVCQVDLSIQVDVTFLVGKVFPGFTPRVRDREEVGEVRFATQVNITSRNVKLFVQSLESVGRRVLESIGKRLSLC